MTTIVYVGDPYPTARTIDRALEGRGWRVVVMHAEDGGTIRIAPHDWSLWDAGVLVLAPGEQLLISATGGLQVEPIPVMRAGRSNPPTRRPS